MKLTTLSSKLTLLSVNSNAKTTKSSDLYPDTLTAILYLSPHTLGGAGNVCAHATEGCKQTCLYSAGRGKFNTVQQARIKKTKLFFEDNDSFKLYLLADLNMFYNYCKEHKLNGYVRLNGTSDINWQKIKISGKTFFEHFPSLSFYDYTKDIKRKALFTNYHLTFSYSENVTIAEVTSKLKNNINVAVVFDTLPDTWKGFEVVNGDLSDLRPKDKSNVIIGLKAKGLAKTIKTDFVIKTLNI